jgi:hypothetical protein
MEHSSYYMYNKACAYCTCHMHVQCTCKCTVQTTTRHRTPTSMQSMSRWAPNKDTTNSVTTAPCSPRNEPWGYRGSELSFLLVTRNQGREQRCKSVYTKKKSALERRAGWCTCMRMERAVQTCTRNLMTPCSPYGMLNTTVLFFNIVPAMTGLANWYCMRKARLRDYAEQEA